MVSNYRKILDEIHIAGIEDYQFPIADQIMEFDLESEDDDNQDESGDDDFFCPGTMTPTQSQLIQIYSVDWTDVYNTHTTLNTEQKQ